MDKKFSEYIKDIDSRGHRDPCIGSKPYDPYCMCSPCVFHRTTQMWIDGGIAKAKIEQRKQKRKRLKEKIKKVLSYFTLVTCCVLCVCKIFTILKTKGENNE